MKFELIATATFGLEAVVKREVEALGFKVISSDNAKITYIGDERGIVKSNLWLRSADRVLIKLTEFKAKEFEDLFQNVKGIAWEEYLPQDANFIVNANSVKSTLRSVPSVQSVAEKAIISKLSDTYGIQKFSKSGSKYSIRITLLKDKVTVMLDTSGAGLHKRGYRVRDVKAPIKETLAAAMVQLSFWNKDRLLVDPFCGSGTVPIEAAMIGRNIAPGLSREFAAEDWELIDKGVWKEERKKAFSEIDNDVELKIFARDIDKKAIEAARENAIEAGVDDAINFRIDSFEKLQAQEEYGIIITNPPYGERMGEEKALEVLYSQIGKFFNSNPTWSLYLITSDKSFETKAFNKPADRRRKLYNGRIETCYYQYYGEKRRK